MIIIGLILVLASVAAAILLFEGTKQLTDGVDISVFGGQISLPPLALLITGAAVITVFWLGWVLLRTGVKRNSRKRRTAKDEAAAAEQQRVDNERKMKEDLAQRERALAEERRRLEQETAALRTQTGGNPQAGAQPPAGAQNLSPEEAQRRAALSQPPAQGAPADPNGPASRK